jgi:hypothetical protein
MASSSADARGSSDARIAAAVFTLIFVAPLTVYLAAPPILNAGLAQEECEQIADVVPGAPEDAEARWTRLPLAQWECFIEDELVARLGWNATETSDSSVELLD